MSNEVKTQTKSSRNFQLTLNEVEYFAEVRDYLLSLKKFQYMIACKEKAPSTGHEHIHIYVQFSDSLKLSIKRLKGAHIEKCRGSAQQNIAYIKKDGDIIFERGDPILKGGHTIKEVKDMDKEKRDQLPLVYYNIVKKIEIDEAKDINVDEYYKDVKVYYIWGESGVGKTKWAIEDMKKNNIIKFNAVKFDGQFWAGVKDNRDVALYDDWRDSHMKPSEFINFIDYNRHLMNVKGGAVRNNYKRIYITSVQSPEEIYKNVDGEPRKQWERRMNVVHIGEKMDECWVNIMGNK